jgi:hypothetical protein
VLAFGRCALFTLADAPLFHNQSVLSAAISANSKTQTQTHKHKHKHKHKLKAQRLPLQFLAEGGGELVATNQATVTNHSKENIPSCDVPR